MRSRETFLLSAFLVVALVVGAVTSVGAAPMMGTYVGYLMDVACGASGHGADGSDTFNSPWDHTKACAVVCKGSGYGVMVRDGDQYKLLKFDPAGSAMAFDQVINKTTKDKAIMVSVDGSLDMGVIKVTSIREANVF